jgi:putative transposase
MKLSAPSYYRHRFPSEIISRCVWLYFRFALSYRDVEEMMHERGVNVTYETVHEWCLKFGHLFAKQLRSRGPPGDRWHLDEVFLKINGQLPCLWHAVDQDGEVLDILVQSRRNKPTARKFFRKLPKAMQYVPRLIITDKLGSYAAAKDEVLPSVERRRDKGLKNRAKIRTSPPGSRNVA